MLFEKYTCQRILLSGVREGKTIFVAAIMLPKTRG